LPVPFLALNAAVPAQAAPKIPFLMEENLEDPVAQSGDALITSDDGDLCW
jgi:hypothetical protein